MACVDSSAIRRFVETFPPLRCLWQILDKMQMILWMGGVTLEEAAAATNLLCNPCLPSLVGR